MMLELSEIKNVQNKVNESYPCLFSVSTRDIEGGKFVKNENRRSYRVVKDPLNGYHHL